MPSNLCPSHEILERYAAGDLSEEEAGTFDSHLGSCTACMKRLDELASHPNELVAALQRKPGAGEQQSPRLARAVAAVLSSTATRRPATPVSDSVGGYRILEEIGRGGMGRVYRARHPRLEREVALKLLRPGLDSAEVIVRFEAERETLARMDHPHIARVLDGGATDDGQPYFVMELVRGAPITRYCDEHQLDLRQRLKLFIDVCLAVQHAHQKGIIHRDIKPSNVLVAEFDGRPAPKVIDFGVAKALGRRTTADTEVGTLIGTLEYMSPEQAELNSSDVDTRSDIYSLGALLFELLTGDTPFERRIVHATPVLEALRVIREVNPPAPSTRLAQIDSADRETRRETASRAPARAGVRETNLQEVDWIVLKALDKDRARRYESAAALAQDVERFLRDEPVSAGPPSRVYRLRKFIRRNRGSALAAGLILGALLAGIAGTTTGMVRARRAQANADDAAAAAKVSERTAVVERDVADSIRAFFQDDLLRQASGFHQLDAGYAPEPNLKLRDVLDRAARRIGGRFDRHPLVEAGIRQTIGAAYCELGAYPDAREHIVRAVELYSAEAGPEDPRTLTAQDSLVLLLCSEGRPAEAVPIATQVLAARRRLHGDEHDETLRAWNHLASALGNSGEYARAEALLMPALEIARRTRGPDDVFTLGTQRNLGMIVAQARGPQAAEPLFREVHDGCLRVRGAADISTAQAATDLAGELVKLRRLDEAGELLGRALTIMEQRLGPEHGKTLMARRVMATLKDIKGDRPAAARDFATLVPAMRRVFGPENFHALEAQSEYGTLLFHLGEREKGAKILAETYAAQCRAPGPEHPHTLATASNLAGARGVLGRHAEAEEMMRSVLEVRRRRRGERDQLTLMSASNLANLCAIRGNFPDAIALLTQNVAARGDTADPRQLASDLRTLAMSYYQLAKYADADPVYARRLELIRRSLAGDDALLADALTGLGVNRLRRGRAGEAEPLLREALPLLDKQQANWYRHYIRCMLGAALTAQKKFTEAEPLLLAGYQGLEKLGSGLPPEARPAKARASGLVAEYYEATGDQKKAAEWKQRHSGDEKQK